MIELVVAMGILSATMLPVAYSFVQEQRLVRAYYYRAIAMEIVDGEIETLLAGEWRGFPKGQQNYRVHAGAATNLPPGQFVLTIDERRMRLEWQPKEPGKGGSVTRETALPTAPGRTGDAK